MKRRYALKRLTASDLTIFSWHFRNHNAGNQKAINLNADVFVEALYPSIEEAAREADYRLAADLWLFGPGGKSALNLQRKIIKGGAYKNWRLNGEFIHNPDDDEERFNGLAPNDLVVLEFVGDVIPRAVNAVFVAASDAVDAPLYAALDSCIGSSRMVAVEQADLERLCKVAALSNDHPLTSILVDIDLEEATQGVASAAEKALFKRRSHSLSVEAFRKARDSNEEVGRRGEALVDLHLARMTAEGNIEDYNWISSVNVVAPFDFEVRVGGATNKVDVKSTKGEFDRDFHVSRNELLEMAEEGVPYRIFRVFKLEKNSAKLRVSQDMTEWAKEILEILKVLPEGVAADGITISPKILAFADELELLADPEED